ncbi:MAG TPA: IS4 family transposase [Ktedonobacteraceae bacterium]|nr:IS4 family transposase [Ktedonobacteraceae bacterium]
MHHSLPDLLAQPHAAVPFFETVLVQALPADPPTPKGSPRGAPQKLSWMHLWFGFVLGILQGVASYQGVQRLLAADPLGPFAKVVLTDDALVKRLRQAGIEPLQQMLARLSAVLAPLLRPAFPADLAAFAREILALDETTWEAVQRHLAVLRVVPKGDERLVPGKLAGRFNVRTQQWDLIQLRTNPVGNCKLDLCSLLEGLLADSLLLFDLGYFSYPFFDYLTQRHFWFISRLREKVCYQIVHEFYRQAGTLDALVWLGSTGRNSPRTGCLLRLVRFWDGHELRMYLTNQTDPLALPLPDIARLYARRWDIELAFLTLKAHLGLHHWWSGHPVLQQQQALVVLIAAQLLHALRVLIALDAGCDPFEVSLPLLVEYLPQILHQRLHPVSWAMQHGDDLGLFRPSSRYVVQAPVVPTTALCFPPADLPRTRLACYLTYKQRPHRSPRKKPRRSPASSSRASPRLDK